MKKYVFALAALALTLVACEKKEEAVKDTTPAQLVSFELLKADNAFLDQDYAPASISENMLIRIPDGGMDKTFTATIKVGENDKLYVNGKTVEGTKAQFEGKYAVDIEVVNTKSSKVATYEVKIGKILKNVVTAVGSYTEADAAMKSDIRIAVNPKADTPYILYSRKKTVDGTAEANNRLACVSWSNGAFSPVGTLGFTDDSRQAVMSDIAFCDETPYVLFYGETASGIFGVRKFDGTDWAPVGEKGSSSKTTASLGKPQLYFVNGNPAYVATGYIGKKDAGFRNATRYEYDGTQWNKTEFINGLPHYGDKGGTDGMFYYGPVATDSKGTVYLAASINQYGYYLFNVSNSWEKLVDSYIPEGEAYGVPSSLTVATAPDGTVYLLAAVSSKSQYQVYRYNKDAASKLDIYADAIQLTAGSSGAVKETMHMAINPVSGEIVGVYAKDDKLYFSAIQDNKWNEFSAIEGTKAMASSSDFGIAFDTKGNCYIAYVADVEDATSIELYKYGVEEDILPE